MDLYIGEPLEDEVGHSIGLFLKEHFLGGSHMMPQYEYVKLETAMSSSLAVQLGSSSVVDAFYHHRVQS